MDKKEKGSHAQGDNPVEKQASQLAYDVKYKVKAAMNKGTKMNPAQVAKAYLSQLAKSPASPAVKAMAKKKLMGEEYTQDIKTLVQGAVVNAMVDVFTEAVEGKKFKIRVTDKKTGNTYIRNADRAKIAELRANPNISSVEITSHGEVSGDGEKKAKKDYDGDGKVESGAKEYRGAVHNAIQKKKGGKADGQDTSSVKEEIIYEKEEKKSKITGKNVNNYSGKESVVKLFPKLGESKTLDELFGPQTVTPKNSPSGTKSVQVGKPYPAKLNGKPVMKTYDKSGGSSTRPMSAIEKIPLYRKYGHGQIGPMNQSFEPEGEMVDENLAQMAANVTDALPWNRNTRYTTQGKLRKPGENVHGKQTGRGLNTSTASMSASGTAKTNRQPNPMLQGGKVVQKNSFELDGEDLQEKPGDGYLGPTPIPNPIRLAKDAVDATNRTNAEKVKRINKLRPGSASMPKHTYFNKGPSAASQRYLGLKNSFEPDANVVEEDCGSCSNCGGKGCAMCAKGKNEGDERELRTKMDLIKNKMRSAGIKVAGETPVARNRKMGGDVAEGMKQARANVGASKCWDGYKAKGTKKKDGKEVPNCVKEEGSDRRKDRRQERGGVGANVDYSRPPAKKATNKELGIRDFSPEEKEKRRKEIIAHLKKRNK